MWIRQMGVEHLRNIAHAELELGPGLNVFHGRNAQGKTTLLEAVGLLARGRSFRTEEAGSVIQRGSGAMRAMGLAESADERQIRLQVEIGPAGRRLSLDGRAVAPGAYQGRLDVVVYSTERLRVIRGPMRERRQFIDRAASALWPAYRRLARDYERVVTQRNAALEAGRGDLSAWTEQLLQLGAALRVRREAYVARLREALRHGRCGDAERYDVELGPRLEAGEPEARRDLGRELEARSRDERRLRRSLCGPHRDAVRLLIDSEEAAHGASSGQVRSLLLALTLATRDVFAQERGSPPVTLLDDLDSELDEERAAALCRDLAARGQALVTTAHAAWARSLDGLGWSFEVVEGRVEALGVS